MNEPSIFDMREMSPIGTYSIPGTPLRLRIRLSGFMHGFDVLDRFGNVDPYMSADFRTEFDYRLVNAKTAAQMGTWLQARWQVGKAQATGEEQT